MIKYAREQFFLNANELVNSLQSKNSKSYWIFVKRMMKGTGNNYTIHSLYNGSSVELVYEDKAKADPLNQYFCSNTFINDSNRESPNVVQRTHAILSNIDVNIQDVRTVFVILFKKKGMTLANFQSDGNLQIRKEYQNRILMGKHIVSEVAFNIWWLIPSSPPALPI
jgi:hypothetical protein